MQNLKTALAVAFVFFGLPILWAGISTLGLIILNWLHQNNLDTALALLAVVGIFWLYVKIVSKLWK